MRSWHAVVAAGAAAVLLGACGGDDGGSPSMEELEGVQGTCPFDLDATAAAAGLGEEGGDVEVEVASSLSDQNTEALGQPGAVFVECTRPLAGGDERDDPSGDGADDERPQISGYLVASEQPGAVSLLLPLMQDDLPIDLDELDGIIDRYNAAGEGDLVDLGAEGPWAAARIAVADADSAVLYVAASDGAASATQVRDVVERLVDEF